MEFQEGCPITINRPYTVERIRERTLMHQQIKMRQKDLNCGDLTIKDSGGLGFDVYFTDTGEKVMFLNDEGSYALLRWLLVKYKDRLEKEDDKRN